MGADGDDVPTELNGHLWEGISRGCWATDQSQPDDNESRANGSRFCLCHILCHGMAKCLTAHAVHRLILFVVADVAGKVALMDHPSGILHGTHAQSI
jgi:hypothetical protein